MTALTDQPPFISDACAEPAPARSVLRGAVAKGTPAPPCLLITERRLRGCAVMFVRGEIDISTVEQLDDAGTRLLESAGARLVLDLSETTFMDLRGVRTAERLSRVARETGGSFALVARVPAVVRILALASHPWLVVTHDLDTALEVVADRASN